MNIGEESEAFVAEPLPEPTEVPVEPETEQEEVLVPAARHEREEVVARA